MTNNQLTDAQISNATLIRLIRWADEHKSHYVAAALRELQERRKADSEPYGFTDGDRRGMIYEPQYADRLKEPLPVYRHAQQPVVPEEMTPEMMRAVQLNSELGSYAAANLTDAYSLYREFWSVAIAASPQEVK